MTFYKSALIIISYLGAIVTSLYYQDLGTTISTILLFVLSFILGWCLKWY